MRSSFNELKVNVESKLNHTITFSIVLRGRLRRLYMLHLDILNKESLSLSFSLDLRGPKLCLQLVYQVIP